jgi:hypothetical protein
MGRVMGLMTWPVEQLGSKEREGGVRATVVRTVRAVGNYDKLYNL